MNSPIKIYMDAVDFFHEIDACVCATYPSLEAILEEVEHVRQCGVVEIEIDPERVNYVLRANDEYARAIDEIEDGEERRTDETITELRELNPRPQSRLGQMLKDYERIKALQIKRRLRMAEHNLKAAASLGDSHGEGSPEVREKPE